MCSRRPSSTATSTASSRRCTRYTTSRSPPARSARTTRGATSHGRRHGRDDRRSGHVRIEIVQRGAPDVALGFCHRDYHPGNVLWSRRQVSGVVDWTHACHGAPAVDVAHCALNLAVLFGTDVAAEFAAPLRAGRRARVVRRRHRRELGRRGTVAVALARRGPDRHHTSRAHRCRRRVPRARRTLTCGGVAVRAEARRARVRARCAHCSVPRSHAAGWPPFARRSHARRRAWRSRPRTRPCGCRPRGD